MEGDVVSLSSFSSASLLPSAAVTEKDSSPKSVSSPLRTQHGPKSTGDLWTEDVSPVGERLLSEEEHVTLITESMTVTSTDQEKLLLLNRNTELRRVNKELMKLNEDWDQVYRSATLGLQHRLEAFQLENSTIKQINNRLLLKIEYEQTAKEYYEQALMLELKKNQDLQEYIRMLESRVQHSKRDCTPAKQGSLNAVVKSPVLCLTNDAPGGPNVSSSQSWFCPASSSPEAGLQENIQNSRTPVRALGDSQQEMQDLKEQLEALRCQTQIYEAEYQTEHKDHKNTLQENRRLRKKREEMRQQVALLQEQLKLYEDDFRRERSDKQMLQRLLKKTAQTKQPVLIHRCNNEQQPLGGDNGTQSGESAHPQSQSKQHHPLCPKHRDQKESA